jgi:hypothetical protein
MKTILILIMVLPFLIVVSISATVFEEWTAQYNGPASLEDRAVDIAVDTAGNVYVTGSSWSGNNIYPSDYATVKYDTSGNQQWAVRYDGPAGYEDSATAVAVDTAGNVYVTGKSMDASATYDYVTIKYSANGIELWTARYNGPGNDADIAHAIALDAAGNVYVTGQSYISEIKFYDYATIKYNSSGVQQWVAYYDGPDHVGDIPYAIQVDLSGNVFVTGESGGFIYSGGNLSYFDHDYATVKYNSSGGQVWVRRYDGTAGKDDYSRDLVLDSSGNAYVTGMSRTSDSITFDYVTIKYTSGGSQSWARPYHRTGNDQAQGITIDSLNNIYVTGLSEGSGTGLDYATIKYNSAGTQQWAVFYNGPASGDDKAEDITVDTSGNVYVTGLSEGAGTGFDYASVKYDSAGNEQWIARLDGPAGSDDEASTISHDSAGNAYVTGHIALSGTDLDYATVKYATCAGSARIEDTTPVYFDSLQNAYNNAGTYDTIRSQIYIFNENLILNAGKTIILEAGYNCDFSVNTGTTTIKGDVIISGGSITVQSGTIEVQ